ncbi:UPF0182 family protein [Nakamurella sp. A5-74]|uniref:UPF0182 protein ABLG96_07705 n=1 Tax=Nakamurella sp. A5-74 TaxID=3158264 RepID=A0AAU8DWE5_9ACTN
MGMRPGMGIPTMSRRAKRVLTAIVALVVLAILWFQFVSVYVDFLWFGEVGFREVFTTQALTRIVLFLVVGAVAAGLVLGAMVVAYRSRPVFVPSTNEQDPLAPYRIIISSRPRLIAIVAAVLIGLISGISAQGNWQTVQLFLHGGNFGKADPQFGHDIGFYVFRLPLIQMVLGWLFVITAICAVIVAVVQYLFGGLRTQGAGRKVTSAATLQLSLLVGFFVLIKAVQYWFDRYNLLFSDRSAIFTGASYTDVNAVLPAKIILMVIAAICAVGFIVGAILRSVKLPALAVALLVLSSVLIGGLWPLILQQVVVKPNANTREPAYISKNLDATRTAFGIGDDKVTYVPYQGETAGDKTDIVKDTDTVPNARLLDPNILSPTFTQNQQLKNWYGFASQLSVDRYTIGGKTGDFLVALRELNTAGLSANQQDWIQRHLVYTHGDGFVAAPANEVVNGVPNYRISEVSKPAGFVPISEPRIYYGQLTTDYSIVGSAAGDPARELETDSSTYTYQGSGGVSLGNLFQRLVFATNYSEMNFLFSSGINDNSKILYNRDPRTRVEKAAPFLTTDTKPYPAVVDGRIVWIVDAYTTAENYPYSQNVLLGDATTNSSQSRGAEAQVNKPISYIRNSVKATVDAYDGTVTLYQVDDADPLLEAWKGVFPGIVKPQSDISPDLRAHFRYPEDLFEVQRGLITKYNVSDPVSFFNNSGFWKVPGDPTSDTTLAQPPYYLQVKLPGEGSSGFALTSVMTGFAREFMASYMAASSDPETYGKITVLQLPTNTQTPGPAQVQNYFRTTQEISQLVTLSQQPGGTKVLFGNLLTLPVNNGLLYVEPFYIQGGASTAQFPQLNRVLVWYRGLVGVGSTLAEALVKAQPPDTSGTNPDGSPSSGAPSSTQSGGQPSVTSGSVVPPSNEAGARAALQAAYLNLELAKKTGDQELIGAANKRLEAAVTAYLGVTSSGLPSSTPITSAPSSSTG